MRLSGLLLPLVLLASLACGTGPAGETSNIEVRALNMALATKASELKVQYLDTYSILTGSDGNPMPFFFGEDGEHLSELGYLRWADSTLQPYITDRKVTCAVMVGDSITYRTYVVKLENGTKEATWADLLGIPAYNEGRDGDTSQDVLNRLDELIHSDADCYFVMIGNNDLHAGVRIEQIVGNVDTLVRQIRSRTGKRVVIQAVMPLIFK